MRWGRFAEPSARTSGSAIAPYLLHTSALPQTGRMPVLHSAVSHFRVFGDALERSENNLLRQIVPKGNVSPRLFHRNGNKMK